MGTRSGLYFVFMHDLTIESDKIMNCLWRMMIFEPVALAASSNPRLVESWINQGDKRFYAHCDRLTPHFYIHICNKNWYMCHFATSPLYHSVTLPNYFATTLPPLWHTEKCRHGQFGRWSTTIDRFHLSPSPRIYTKRHCWDAWAFLRVSWNSLKTRPNSICPALLKILRNQSRLNIIKGQFRS